MLNWYIPLLLLLIAGRRDGPRPSVQPEPESTHYFQRHHGWIAGDGALSIALSNQHVLWLFGDSHIDDYDSVTGTTPCLFQVRNAALLQPQGDWDPAHSQTLIGQGPGFKSYFKNQPDDQYWFWPGAGFQQGDTIYVFLNSLRKTKEGGLWGWTKGPRDYWAKIPLGQWDKISYEPLRDFGNVSFGQGFVQDKQKGYLYAYGSRLKGISGELLVARVDLHHPEGPWQFWDGHRFQPALKAAVPVAKGASNSIQVCQIKDQFLMISTAFSVGCDQGKQIYAATASEPTGPFSQPKAIYTLTDTLQGHYPFFYMATAHPAYVNAENELLITYCINGYSPCVNTCTAGRFNPDYYRPKAIRVPLDVVLQK